MASPTIQDHLRGTGPHDRAEVAAGTPARESGSDPAGAGVVTAVGDPARALSS